MKKILKLKLILCIVLFTSTMSASAQLLDSDPALTSMSFAKSPVTEGTGTLSDTTILTVTFVNNGFFLPVFPGFIQLNISLPTSVEYKGFPENSSAVSGTYASAFTWSYNAATRTFSGINNGLILPGDGGTIQITVKGYIATPGRISVANIIKLLPVLGNNPNNDNLTASLAVASGGIVPVTLLNFNAAPQDKSVLLTWQTSTELNSKNFEVEYSLDGNKFSSVGTVAAAGNSSSTSNYSFVHTQPINGFNYYRLKQVDLDGRFTYSEIRKVKFGARADIYALPNPTTDNVYVVSGDGAVTAGTVGIYDQQGKLLQQIENYVYSTNISLARFAPGTYILKVTAKDHTIRVMQIVKR